MIESSKFINYDFFKQNTMQSLDQIIDWKQVFTGLFKRLDEKNSNNNSDVILIVDDMSILNLIGCDENFIFEFINKIQSYSNLNINLIFQYQSFWTNKFILKDLIHMSDVYFKVEDLVTGYSKEIQGQVRIFIIY